MVATSNAALSRRRLPMALGLPDGVCRSGRVLLVTLWLLPAIAFGDATRFVAPIPSPEVVRGFDPPEQRWLPGHRGVDLTATPGAAVRAAGDGRVRFAGVGPRASFFASLPMFFPFYVFTCVFSRFS